MKKAYVLVRPIEDQYPYTEIITGLKAAGAHVCLDAPNLKQTDFTNETIITWNNYGSAATYANHVKAHGGDHLSIENGYTNSFRQDKCFALSHGAHHHIDRQWVAEKLSLRDNLKLWMPLLEQKILPTGPVIVAGQRGGDYSTHSMPKSWPDDIIYKIRKQTSAPIWYRPHPARARLPLFKHDNLKIVSSAQPFKNQLLEFASRVVVYTSNFSTEAIFHGVPTYYDGPTIPLLNLAHKNVQNLDFVQRYDYNTLKTSVGFLLRSEFTRRELANGATWEMVL